MPSGKGMERSLYDFTQVKLLTFVPNNSFVKLSIKEDYQKRSQAFSWTCFQVCLDHGFLYLSFIQYNMLEIVYLTASVNLTKQ